MRYVQGTSAPYKLENINHTEYNHEGVNYTKEPAFNPTPLFILTKRGNNIQPIKPPRFCRGLPHVYQMFIVLDVVSGT